MARTSEGDIKTDVAHIIGAHGSNVMTASERFWFLEKRLLSYGLSKDAVDLAVKETNRIPVDTGLAMLETLSDLDRAELTHIKSNALSLLGPKAVNNMTFNELKGFLGRRLLASVPIHRFRYKPGKQLKRLPNKTMQPNWKTLHKYCCDTSKVKLIDVSIIFLILFIVFVWVLMVKTF